MRTIHRWVKLALALFTFAIGTAVVIIGMLFIGLSYWMGE